MTTHCPICAAALIRIVYGMPARSLRARAQAGEVRLGGCVVWPDRPELWCAACRISLRAENGVWTRTVTELGVLGMATTDRDRFVIGRDAAECAVAAPPDWEFVAPVHAVLERVAPGRWRVSRPAAAEASGTTAVRRGRTTRPLEPGQAIVVDDRIASGLTITDATGGRRFEVEWTVFR